MNNVRELVSIAKEISSDYLENKKNMTSSLMKAAEQNKLTEEEIKRVAEMANTRTYLELKKSAEYVKFDIVDPSSVIKKEKPVIIKAANSTHEDFLNAPELEIESLEKAASIDEKTEDLIKQAEELESQIPAFEKTLLDLKSSIGSKSVKYDERVRNLAEKVRQLLLQGVEPSIVKGLFQSVDESGIVWSKITELLNKEFPMIKEASYNSDLLIDEDNYISKEASYLKKIASEIVSEVIIHNSILNSFTKESSMFINKVKTPLKVLGLGAGLGTAYMYGKKTEQANDRIKKLQYVSSMRPSQSLT